MSIPVAPTDLRSTSSNYGFAYLLTVSDNGRAHAVAIRPSWTDDGGAIRIAEPGRKTAANASARPDITLIWPPASIEDYSLIADGTATFDGTVLVFTPATAVLHRPAPAGEHGGDGTSLCGSDCSPVTTQPN